MTATRLCFFYFTDRTVANSFVRFADSIGEGAGAPTFNGREYRVSVPQTDGLAALAHKAAELRAASQTPVAL